MLRKHYINRKTSYLGKWLPLAELLKFENIYVLKLQLTDRLVTLIQEQSTTLFSGKSLAQRNEGNDASRAGLGNALSSTQLLARMRARNSIGGVNAGSDVQSSEQKYVDIMTEVRNFIATGCSLPGRATTQEILAEFSSRLPVNDSAIFREMLRNIADFDRCSSGEGFWFLKPDFT